MKPRTLLARLLPLLLLAAAVPLAAQDAKPAAQARPETKKVRAAAERSLVFLEKEGLGWMKERKCIACHHGPFMLWSHREALERGLNVDAKKLEDWSGQALDMLLAKKIHMEYEKNGGVETMHMLLAHGKAPADAKRKNVASLLVNAQQADGFWKYEGMEIDRALAESNEATTSWGALALAPADGKDQVQAREKALAWLKKTKSGEGNEVATVRLLVAARFGDSTLAKDYAKDLRSRQNADGGWSWARSGPSDAFATGQALYALSWSGPPSEDPAAARAIAYLLEKQRADGSWYSPTRKPKTKDNPIAVYWGSAWATLGLVRSLPPAAK